MNGPTLTAEIAGIARAFVGRVTCEVGVVIQRVLEDRQELVALYIRVERALAARRRINGIFRRVGVLACIEVSFLPYVEGTMGFQLVQTVASIEETPADEVEATTKLAAELLRTLHIGNLLEQQVLGIELALVQVGQLGTVAHLVNPFEGVGRRTIDLVLALSSAQQHVRVAHQTEVDTIVKTCNHLVVQTCAQVGVLGDGQTTIVIVGNDDIGSCCRGSWGCSPTQARMYR